jgi:hypothetical protein
MPSFDRVMTTVAAAAMPGVRLLVLLKATSTNRAPNNWRLTETSRCPVGEGHSGSPGRSKSLLGMAHKIIYMIGTVDLVGSHRRFRPPPK